MSDPRTNVLEPQSGEDEVVAISFTGVEELAIEMEDLATRAQGLQASLDDLKIILQKNWEDEAARALFIKYDDFVANIEIITADINSVKEWSRDTAALFKAKVGENQDNINSAIGGN